MKKFVVIDQDGQTSFSSESEKPEVFFSEEEAIKRAAELAASAPGEDIEIYALQSKVKCPVGRVQKTDYRR